MLLILQILFMACGVAGLIIQFIAKNKKFRKMQLVGFVLSLIGFIPLSIISILHGCHIL